MIKKCLFVLILTIFIFTISGCNSERIDKNEPYARMFELVDRHLYNENIEVKVPLENGYHMLNMPYIGMQYVAYLDQDCFVTKINVKNVAKFIKKHTNDKTFIINSKVDKENATFYINEDGEAIILIDDKLYISEKETVEYDKIISYSSMTISELLTLNTSQYNSSIISTNGMRTDMIFLTIYNNNEYRFGASKAVEEPGRDSAYNKRHVLNQFMIFDEGNIHIDYDKLNNYLEPWFEMANNDERVNNFETPQETSERVINSYITACIEVYRDMIYQEKYINRLFKKDTELFSCSNSFYMNERKKVFNANDAKYEYYISLNDGKYIFISNGEYLLEYDKNYYVVCEKDFLDETIIQILINHSDDELNAKVDQVIQFFEENYG